MGVKPQYVKDVGDAVFERYPDAISTDFEHNKTVVDETTTISSTEVRNRVAGYLAREATKRRRD